MEDKLLKSGKKPRVLDCKAVDNKYLHKDFHGVLCYSIKYLDDQYGQEATKEYLQQTAKTCFVPSKISKLNESGIPGGCCIQTVK